MHLRTEVILDLLDNRLEQANQQESMAHLESCPDCAREAREWREIYKYLKPKHLQSAPSVLLNRAVALFKKAPEVHSRPSIRTVVAEIIYDSFAQPAFAGARGATSAARQVVMRADRFDVHMRISATNETHELMGQIQPRGTREFVDSARLHLLQDGERVVSAHANELGEFHFNFIPQGFLSLQIDLPYLTVIGALEMNDRS